MNTYFEIAGEPQAVRDARALILNRFADLLFFEEGHRYLLHGKELCSVSGIGHRFESRPFNRDAQAESYARRHGRTPEYWLHKWDCNSFRATTLGHKTHSFGESLGYLRAGHPDRIAESIRPQYDAGLRYLAPIHPKEEAIVRFMDELPSSYHLVLNEAMVYSGLNPDAAKNLREQICGTFDMLYYYDGEGDPTKAGFVVLDYKTNSELESEYNRSRNIMLLPPFQDMVQESLGTYTIQLSLYALMLEDIGLPIIDRRIVWLREDGTYQLIPTPDVSERLRQVL